MTVDNADVLLDASLNGIGLVQVKDFAIPPPFAKDHRAATGVRRGRSGNRSEYALDAAITLFYTGPNRHTARGSKMKSTELSLFLAESYGLQFLTPPQVSPLSDGHFRYLKTPAATFSQFDAFSDALAPCRDTPFSNKVVFKLVTRGDIRIENRFGKLSLPHGSLSLMPWNPQFEETFTAPTSLYVIGCDRALCQRIMPLAQQHGGYSTQLATDDFAWLTQLIDHYVSQSQQLSPALASIGSQMIISTLGEVLLNSEKVTRTKKVSKMHNIVAIKDYISLNLQAQDLGPEMIAAHMRLSVNYMNRILAEEGLSLMKLVWQLRLEEARCLLTRPLTCGMQMAEIAWQCGFSSQSHFSQAFRRHFGISPTEMRAARPH